MDVLVPDLGDFADVEVIEILVKPGDVVAADASLITLETEKAAMDVPSPAAGTIREIHVAVGSTVSAGDPILVLETDSAEAGAAAPAAVPDGGPKVDTAEADAAAGAVGAGAESVQGGTSATTQVVVPDLGDFSDVEVIDVLVAPGDEVSAEQSLITLETEKAAMDVPSTVAGKVLELAVRVGDRVNAGDAIATIAGVTAEAGAGSLPAGGAAAAAESARAAPGPATAPGARAAAAPVQTPAVGARPAEAGPAATGRGRPVFVDEAGFARAHASPSVRKLARELGVDLVQVGGTGRKGRVTASDVKSHVKAIMQAGPARGALPAVPTVDFTRFGPVETQPLSRIQKISGPRLHASWVNVPHVTQHDEADITELEAVREELKAGAAARGIRLTPLAFIMRACALTLAEFPAFRSSLAPDGASLIVKNYLHLGFAADTPGGLVVPVIRDADKKDVFELAAALGDLSSRAREGKLKADEIQGGVFTISSLGGIGGTYFTPIINAPEVAILGVSRSSMRPVYKDGGFVPRLLLPLSLSYDHRVIDGAQAARFVTHLSATLGAKERLLEAIP